MLKCKMSRNNEPRNYFRPKNIGNELTAEWKILRNELNDGLLSVIMIVKYLVFIFSLMNAVSINVSMATWLLPH